MRLLGIPRVRAKVIRDAIEEASGEAIPLVEWPAGRNLVAAISVSVAEDGIADGFIVEAGGDIQVGSGVGWELAELRGRFPRLRERVVASRDSFAVVEETMFKGAAASFGTLEYRPPDAGIRKLVLRAGEREILESGFNYHERPAIDFGRS